MVKRKIKSKPTERRITFSDEEARRRGFKIYRDYFTGKFGLSINGQVQPYVEVEFHD